MKGFSCQMPVDYNRLDEVYKEFPEILDLVKAAQWVSQEGYNMVDAKRRMTDAVASLRSAGKALDNRNH